MIMRASGPHWLVQRPPAGDGSPTCGLLHRACDALGLPIEAIDVEPGARVQFPPAQGPTIVHGRKTLLHSALADPVYRRAVFLELESFTPAAYLQRWGARMLNAQQRLVSWAD